MNVQKREVFAGERLFLVMVFLVANEIPERRIVGTADRECRVAILPVEVPPVRNSLVDPTSGVGFDSPYQLRDGDGCGRLHVQVHVIARPTRAEQLAVLPGDDDRSAREES